MILKKWYCSNQHRAKSRTRAFSGAFLRFKRHSRVFHQSGGLPGCFMVVVYRFAGSGCFMAPNFPKAASHGGRARVHCLAKTGKLSTRHNNRPKASNVALLVKKNYTKDIHQVTERQASRQSGKDVRHKPRADDTASMTGWALNSMCGR